jgi:hypothetical protein
MAGGHSATAQMMSDTLCDSQRLLKSAKISTLGGNLRTNNERQTERVNKVIILINKIYVV